MARTILVTGGNRGIGLEVVKSLAKNQEDTVLLGCRDLNSIEIELPDNVKPIEMNLSSKLAVAEAVSQIETTFGDVDVLINNAGVLHEGSILEASIEKIEDSFQVQVLGPTQLIKAFLPKMIKNGYGRIVNVSSGWGSFADGLAGPFSYSTTKAALNAVTLATAQNLPKNVKVNSACPGWVRTRMGGEMASRSVEEGAETILWLANLPEDGQSGGFFRDKRIIEW